MPIPLWSSLYKTFTYAFSDDPISRKLSTREIVGSGIVNPDSVPSISPDNSFSSDGGQRLVRFRETNDFIDLSTISNRISRYKEYERLMNMAEIEMALSVFSDEACVSGKTKVNTPFGLIDIATLTATKANEKFLVYCYDFEKRDYTLGWAHSPRKTKTAHTIRISFDDGKHLDCTPDHKILMRDGTWKMAGELKIRDEVMPFYRIKPKGPREYKHNQYPRIFTHSKGWMHERQFADEWRVDKDLEDFEKFTTAAKLLSRGVTPTKLVELTKTHRETWKYRLQRQGFTFIEFKALSRQKDRRTVINTEDHGVIDVYDLTVDKHHNFATENCIVHNCQKDNDGRVFEILVDDDDIREELEFLFFNRNMLNFNARIWSDFRNLLTYGDLFYEIIINHESPDDGIYKINSLPPDSMYRIETTKGRIIEFQQSKEGPDYTALMQSPVTQASDATLLSSTAIRFAPEQVVHIRVGEDRRTFYPYGVSVIEPARGPAHQLRLMEDSMLVYRLARAPERRVFYIDVGQLPPFKTEMFIERLKDQFRKRKVPRNFSGSLDANSVDEKWHAPAVDEDYWIPIRANSQTKIDTLPGASALGEIDDAVYFRSKLFAALNFPRNYFNVDDPAVTKTTLSSQSVSFARVVERMQSHMEDGLWQIATRHLRLKGYPEDKWENLHIRMTPPSEYRELSRAEIISARITNATNLKTSTLMGDYDVLTKWLKYGHQEALEIQARSKLQKLDDARLEILKANPELMGVGVPGGEEEENKDEIGTTPGGPNPQIGGDLAGSGEGPEAAEEQKDLGQRDLEQDAEQNKISKETGGESSGESSAENLYEPTPEELDKYGFNTQDFAKEMDHEEGQYNDY
jgi:hypothetical protein